MIETDDGKENVSKTFNDLLKENNFKRYSRYTSLGFVFVERFTSSIRDLLKTQVFENGERNWLDVLPTKLMQLNIKIHSSTKVTAIEVLQKKWIC